MLLHSSISVQIEQNAVRFKIAPRKHESIFNFFFANNKRPLIIWFLCHWATVMTACFVAHSNRLTTLSLCLESLRNRTPSNLKLHHISKNPSQKTFGQEDEPPSLDNEALCLSTPTHNGKSDTDNGASKTSWMYFAKMIVL
jgi:hypothetical protein